MVGKKGYVGFVGNEVYLDLSRTTQDGYIQ